MEFKDLLEVLETRVTNIKKENRTHFNEGRIYELELTLGVVKSLLPNSCEQLKDKEETDFEEWKYDNFRYISNTMYERIKTIYFKDELLKIYENETANL